MTERKRPNFAIFYIFIATHQGPEADLQDILRQSYDNAKVMIDL